MNLTVEQALSNVKALAAAFVGNLEQHQAIQASLKLIENELLEKKLSDKPKEELKPGNG